jgi:hypothetical protein
MSLTISQDNTLCSLSLIKVVVRENDQIQAVVLYYPYDEIFDILKVDQTVFYHGRCYSFSEVLGQLFVGETSHIETVFRDYMDQVEPGSL